MKRIADFLVKGRYWLFVIFILFAAASGFMMQRVNVNTDMTKYLPDDSQMKEGMDILEEQFPNMSNDSVLRVMFTGLSDDEKIEMLDTLKQLEYVDNVAYEKDSEEYNSGEYTLYKVSSAYDYASDEFQKIEDAVKNDILDKHEGVYATNNTNSEGLPGYILALALAILLAVLFLMSGSWIEPILFMIAIGISIVINMGTNMFLPSVSETTNSIAAVLQLVLAMDYSIILSNKYRQSCKKIDNKVEAMSDAMKGAIPSVCSSALTTIVGLLALCFMSFKIGADLGIVLAKGVFISLLCVFTVLPALLLIFDKLIAATKKKMIPVPVEWLAKFSFKGRYVISGIFVVLFVAVFIAKGNTGISYGMQVEDGIVQVFPKDNTFIVAYNNNDEGKMTNVVDSIKAADGVKAVNSYGTTLGKQMNSDAMYSYVMGMMPDNSSELSLSKEMINLLYYDRFADRTDEELTLEEFVSFVNTSILSNEAFSGQIDDSIKTQFQGFAAICSKEELTKERNASELSAMLGMESSSIEILYQMMQVESMSLVELMSTLQNPQVAVMLQGDGSENSSQAMQSIQLYQLVIESVMAETKYSANEITEMFSSISDGMSDSYVNLIYELYFSQNNNQEWMMSIEELVQYIQTSDTFSSLIDEETKAKIGVMASGLADGKAQLVGKDFSICAITTDLEDGSDPAMEFSEKLDELCKQNLSSEYYIIGNTSMGYEMSQTFGSELNKITIITAVAIFIVVLLTFRSIVLPLILVGLIQASVYVTMLVMGVMGVDMYYLALLIVQSILMGATIDYAIVFSSNYREKREEKEIQPALISAYKASIRTILTSGLIMISVTGILGYAFADPSIGQICHIIAIGVTCAVVMILVFLPGLLAVFDRFTSKIK